MVKKEAVSSYGWIKYQFMVVNIILWLYRQSMFNLIQPIVHRQQQHYRAHQQRLVPLHA